MQSGTRASSRPGGGMALEATGLQEGALAVVQS